MEIDHWLAGLWLLSSVKIKNIRHRSLSRPKTSDNKLALPNFSHCVMTVTTEETVQFWPYFFILQASKPKPQKGRPSCEITQLVGDDTKYRSQGSQFNNLSTSLLSSTACLNNIKNTMLLVS